MFFGRPAIFCAIGTAKDARLDQAANRSATDHSEALNKILEVETSEVKISQMKILETKA
jgi:hypothetical protein